LCTPFGKSMIILRNAGKAKDECHQRTKARPVDASVEGEKVAKEVASQLLGERVKHIKVGDRVACNGGSHGTAIFCNTVPVQTSETTTTKASTRSPPQAEAIVYIDSHVLPVTEVSEQLLLAS